MNVTSSVTLTPMPLAAVYTASKMAIEGFTASLSFELEFFDVRVRLVEPGYCRELFICRRDLRGKLRLGREAAFRLANRRLPVHRIGARRSNMPSGVRREWRLVSACH